MMTPEQRGIAEQIADYVRREVREVGLLLLSGAPDGYGREILDGIPDLSDEATIDALLRHLRRRGWTQERSREGMVGLWRDGCTGVYTIPWKAIAHAIKEEINHEA